MPIRDTQATFGGGELTPALYGRTDIQKYKTGLKTGRNINTLPQGGVRNRPGTAYIGSAYDSANAVRLVSFIASADTAYIIELGNFYARFYTDDGLVQATTLGAWGTGTYYSVGNYATNGGTTYYCLIAHTAGTFATDLAAGKWVAMTAYQVPTPWSADDLFGLDPTAQIGTQLYVAHPDYRPQVISFVSNSEWRINRYHNANGPYQVQNTAFGNTVTPSGLGLPKGTGVFQTNINSILASANGLLIGANAALSIANGDVVFFSGVTGYPQLNDRAFSVTNVFIGGGQTTFNLLELGTSTPYLSQGWPIAGSQTITGYVAVVTPITLTALSSIFVANHKESLFEVVQTVAAQTNSGSFTANTDIGSSIKAGTTYSIVTFGSWQGKILVQISTDGGNSWTTIQTLQSPAGTAENYNVTGDTGMQQGLLRVKADSGVTWGGTLTFDLTASSFDWVTPLLITAYTSATVVSAVPVPQLGVGPGFSSTDGSIQWSFGAWSDAAGWPKCVTFYQDRATWASTYTEPNTVWHTKTASYLDFGVSFPLLDSDGFSVVLASLQLNAVNALIPMPQALLCLSGDMAFGLSPSANGIYSGTAVQQTPMDHRGSFDVPPVVVGNEVILLQQMGTVVRNLIFQLAVNGFMGDNISVASQHLFTGYTIIEMAYQQEPDSIIWAVRSDGVLLSCTYDRAQEMNAWTRHDTDGLYESVAVIPNLELGINEIWVVVNRDGVRMIEALRPRDQGTNPAYQWFVDAGTRKIMDTAGTQATASEVSVPPTVIEATMITFAEAHQYESGDLIQISGLTGANEHINGFYKVSNTTSTTFLLADRTTGELLDGDATLGLVGSPTLTVSGGYNIHGLEYLNGKTVAMFVDGNVVNNGVNDATPLVVSGGEITLDEPATVVLVGLPITWDVGLLDIEVPGLRSGTLQGSRVKMPRAKIRCWNSRGGYISTTEPTSDTGVDGFDALADIMQRPDDLDMDTPLPLVTGIVDAALPSGYQYGAAIHLRGIDPLPFTLLDVIPTVVPGGD